MLQAASVKVPSSNSAVIPLSPVYTLSEGESRQEATTLERWSKNHEVPSNQDTLRNQNAATRIISELKTIQPDAETTFIQKDLTLLKNVDEACDEIKSKETKLNLLFMSQGTASMKSRDGKLLSLHTSDHARESPH